MRDPAVELEPAAVARSQREFYEVIDLVHNIEPERTSVQLDLLRAAGVRATCVLDLGCGEGRQVAGLREVLDHPLVVGVDIGPTLVQARRRGAAPVTAAIDEHTLPFRDASFDVVVFSEVIEHLVDTDGVVEEILRVLVSGGTLLISTPNLSAWFNRLLLLIGVQPIFSEVSRRRVFGRPGSQVAGHLRLFTHRAFREFLSAHGLVDVRITGAPFHGVPRVARWFDRVLARHRPPMAAILVAVATKR